MKNLLLGIVAGVVIIGGGIYYFHTVHVKNTRFTPVSTSTPTSAPVPAVKSTSASSTYDNFGISFQYPSEWGIPNESFYGNGLGSVSFITDASSAQPLDIVVEQDTNPAGTGLLNETFNQMVARFMSNDKYIYQVKNILADGVAGKELFYNSAVTEDPYYVDAYFPFQNNSYVSIGAAYQSVSQTMFDSIISTLKWDSATDFKQDPATGMAIYSNNGIRFEYPVKFNTSFASLMVKTSIVKTNAITVGSNGCQSSSTALTVNGIDFCSSTSGDVGAGQSYTDYNYTTLRNGNTYMIDYSVHTSNGCGVYENSLDVNSSKNVQYNECLAFQKNFNSLVVEPIQQSLSTFTFTN